VPVPLPDELLDLLGRPSLCFVATIMPDDPGNTRRYFAVRGRVIATTTEGGAQSIDEISGKYLGRPYPNFSGRPETRMIMTIEADSVRGMGALAACRARRP
jgi:hypothetical protein